jgi:hypothetical protein
MRKEMSSGTDEGIERTFAVSPEDFRPFSCPCAPLFFGISRSNSPARTQWMTRSLAWLWSKHPTLANAGSA